MDYFQDAGSSIYNSPDNKGNRHYLLLHCPLVL